MHHPAVIWDNFTSVNGPIVSLLSEWKAFLLLLQGVCTAKLCTEEAVLRLFRIENSGSPCRLSSRMATCFSSARVLATARSTGLMTNSNTAVPGNCTERRTVDKLLIQLYRATTQSAGLLTNSNTAVLGNRTEYRTHDN